MPRKTIGTEKAERINVFLPPDLLDKVKEDAKNKGLTVSSWIRMLVTEKMKN